MPMETPMAYQWVDATMRADSALMAAAVGGVWQGDADIGTQPPYAAYGRQTGSDVMTLNAVRLWSSILLQIKAVGPVSGYAALITIANRIDALFKRTGPVGLSSGGVLSCYRESEFELAEIVNGAMWSNLGGLYRIDLQGS